MTNTQRMESDIATVDKRDKADKVLRDNRIRNDELTMERRFEADDMTREKRLKNDELTANRREIKDENLSRDLAVILVTLMVLAVVVLFTSI